MYHTRSHCTNKQSRVQDLAVKMAPSSLTSSFVFCYSAMIDVHTCEVLRIGYCFKVSQSSSPVADPRHLKFSRIYIKFFKNREALLRPLSAARVLIIVARGTMADVELYDKLMNNKLHFQIFFSWHEVLQK